jgi:hypothetical protein
VGRYNSDTKVAILDAEDFEEMKADNDASAIAWGGVFLICAIASILQEEKFLS